VGQWFRLISVAMREVCEGTLLTTQRCFFERSSAARMKGVTG